MIDEVVVARHYGQDTKRRPTDLTFHGDLLQSVLGVSDHNGAVLENTRYAPFGARRVPPSTGTSANPLRYTGRERDPDTDLYYYRARYYDPDLGRFLSEDPLGFGGGDPNFYAYVGNNPMVANDPSGQLAPQVVGGIIGGVGGLAVQIGSDLWRWELSSFSDYAGSVVGGAAGGVAATVCGPLCAGAAAGAASSLVTGGTDLVQGGDLGTVAAQGGTDIAVGAHVGSSFWRGTAKTPEAPLLYCG